MSNHVDLIARSKADFQLPDTIRGLRKFTSKKIEEAIRQNAFESRRECVPVGSGGDAVDSLPQTYFGVQKSRKKNSNNKYFQFWQQDNHPIELYGYETLKQKLNYLHENPVRAGIV